jgi:hypothetical protein
MLLKARVEREKHMRKQITQELSDLKAAEPSLFAMDTEPGTDEEMLALMVEQLKRQHEDLVSQRAKLCQVRLNRALL